MTVFIDCRLSILEKASSGRIRRGCGLAWRVMMWCCLLHLADAREIDNGVLGQPNVTCEDTSISFTFMTKKPFSGRVYVQGLIENKSCGKTFSDNKNQTQFDMVVTHGDCNMARQRMQPPTEGIMFSLVIVVSFHGTFVTKVDRAYRCMCFFRNTKQVTNLLEVSMMTTSKLESAQKMPICTYSIHTNSPAGPPARFAQIGDKIFHCWECDNDNQGMLVHSCWVNDGKGKKFDLLDVDGCAIDPIILPDLTYERSMRKACAETHGFKFSHTSILDFQCVIELCQKMSGECQTLTPPLCGPVKPQRRIRMIDAAVEHSSSSTRPSSGGTFDVVAALQILDGYLVDEQLLSRNSSGSEQVLHLLNQDDLNLAATTHSHSSRQTSCVSNAALTVLLCMFALLFLTSLSTAAILYSRLRMSVAKLC